MIPILSNLFRRFLSSRNRMLVCKDEALEWRRLYTETMFGLQASLKTLAQDTEIKTVIDVGASNGSWSHQCMQAYPDARYLLIEAQKTAHQKGMDAFCEAHQNASCIYAAAGPQPGEVFFDATNPQGGLASTTPLEGGNIISVPMTSVDHEVKTRDLQGPFLLKLDTHGFEVPILEGAASTLAQTNIIVIETYNFFVADGSLRFPKMAQHLEQLGFLPFDLVDLLRRPKDRCLWQFDLVCIRKDRACFQDNQYRDTRTAAMQL